VSGRDSAEIGILGGSGLYGLDGIGASREVRVTTPFGEPSDALRIGEVAGRRVAFLARHGRHHGILPSEINYRANVFAMKLLGVTRILSASAVGSMREDIHPRDVVVPDQFVDRTAGRAATFFGGGVAAHVSLADPVCPVVSRALAAAAEESGARVHRGGTYLCMEGPAFSTRAESRLYRSWGVDVIGMTNLTEAKLAREAEICFSTLALVTDYDCWHEEEEDVTVETLLGHLRANAELAARTLLTAAAELPHDRDGCACGRAARRAVITAPEAIPKEARERMRILLGARADGTS
jgi:5'-methylthioadenosine phosphorylase